MAGHMPLTNGATAAKEAGYRTGKSKKNPEMATDAADTSARAIAEAASGEVGFPSEPDAAGRKTKVPIRNAIRHFSRLMHTPAKAKRRLIN